jgi:hypothetical protein
MVSVARRRRHRQASSRRRASFILSWGYPAAAKHVVRGRIMHGDGRVRIEAEASALAGGAKLGPVTGEATGEDAAAVTKATRLLTEKMTLVCAR